TGNMLEDEKAFKTCHFAIGENYDNDAPSLIHLDGVVRLPTIVINYKDGTSFTALENGVLKI
ncbi:MAG: peptidase M17, partial [Treponemataceae bacterium]|nr:peptidase M17 [Treponemataceae bacterium]